MRSHLHFLSPTMEVLEKYLEKYTFSRQATLLLEDMYRNQTFNSKTVESKKKNNKKKGMQQKMITVQSTVRVIT